MQGNSSNIISSLIFIPIYLIVIILSLVALWKIFSKAGRPGWYSLIPFFNMYQMVKIANKPGWWFLLMFIPIAQIIFSLLIYIGLAKAFGRSTAFGVLLLWFFPIGFLF